MQSLTKIHQNLSSQLWNREKLVHLTWSEVSLAIDHIANRIHLDYFGPDVLIGITRGGLVPAVLLSHRLNIRNVEVIKAKYYDRGYYPSRLSKKPVVGDIDFDTEFRIALLVDDIAGTGDTISAVRSRLEEEEISVRTATLAKNKRCPIEIDYYFATVDDFVVFPWEGATKQMRL